MGPRPLPAHHESAMLPTPISPTPRLKSGWGCHSISETHLHRAAWSVQPSRIARSQKMPRQSFHTHLLKRAASAHLYGWACASLDAPSHLALTAKARAWQERASAMLGCCTNEGL